jgi:SAM-dependent methyltransferase
MTSRERFDDTLARERFYDTLAGEFDRLMNPYDLERRLAVVFDDLLAGRSLSGLRLLDVGCGTGHFSREAQRRGARVTALDIGIELLRRTRASGVIRAVAGDAGALPFANGTFDVVLSSECIEHTASPERCVAEMIRVLTPGGLLALTCPNRLWRWSITLAHALHVRPYHGLENWPGWRTLGRWVAAHGGVVVRRTGIHAFPFQLALTHPVLRRLDRLGGVLGPLYVNQGIAVRVRSG